MDRPHPRGRRARIVRCRNHRAHRIEPVDGAGCRRGARRRRRVPPAVAHPDLRHAKRHQRRPLGAKPTSNGGSVFNVDILGQGGVPAEVGGVNSDVLAVVANVTVVGSGADGYLSIRPAGSAPSESSLVNFTAGETVPNLAVIGVGTGGEATVTLTTPNASTSAHVLVDVFGWISTSSYFDTADSGARLVPVGSNAVSRHPLRTGSGGLAERTIDRYVRAADTADPRGQRGAELVEGHRSDGERDGSEQPARKCSHIPRRHPDNDAARCRAGNIGDERDRRSGQGQHGNRSRRRRRSDPDLQPFGCDACDRRRRRLPGEWRRRLHAAPVASFRSMPRSARSTPVSRRSAVSRSVSGARSRGASRPSPSR